MDFGMYPPEINSGRMYAGPGSGPMQAAAQAWRGLADELYTAASAYQSVVSELTAGSWSGPSSTAMSAAAAPYISWLGSTAAQAEHAATQALAAASAYEAAFASTVPPPVIAANRALLMALSATNFFGQNTAAIAATEAQYAQMWAQDAAAMYGYAAMSASATTLTPFSSPHQNTNPAGTAHQAVAVSHAADTSAGNAHSIVSGVPQTFSAAPAALQSAAPSALSTSLTNLLSQLGNLESLFLSAPGDVIGFGVTALTVVAFYPDVASFFVGQHTDAPVDMLVHGERSGSEAALVRPTPSATVATPAPSASAASGAADTVGGLSVPSGWATAAPEIRSVAKVSPITTATAPLEDAASTFNQTGLGGIAGQAMAGNPAHTAGETAKPVTHARLAAHGPGAASAAEPEATPAPRTVVTGVAAAIRDIAKQRDRGQLTEQEYREQKKRLLEISAGHRPSG